MGKTLQEELKTKTELNAGEVVDHVYAELVVRNNARTFQFKESSPGLHWSGRVVTLIDECFDSYEGGSSATMTYYRADVFTLEDRQYALSIGTSRLGGRIGNKFAKDISLLALCLPQYSKNAIVGFIQRKWDDLAKYNLDQDLEWAIVSGLREGDYFRNTIVAVKEPGLLLFDCELYPRFFRRTRDDEDDKPTVSWDALAAYEIRQKIEKDFCPYFPLFVIQGPKRAGTSVFGEIKYYPQIVPTLVDAIERAIRTHAKTRKK